MSDIMENLDRYDSEYHTLSDNDITMLFWAARNKKLSCYVNDIERCSDDFWLIQDASGDCLAHESARVGFLPDSFIGYDWRNKYGECVAHCAAQGGILPKSFEDLHLKSDDGISVAHVLAEYQVIENGFKHWSLTDGDQNTVAHVYAMYHQSFPDDFDGWHLKDKNGSTVWHEAASNGFIQKGFNYWELKDDEGNMVAHCGAISGILPKDYVNESNMLIANNDGLTLLHACARGGFLPDNSHQYLMITDNINNTVAHFAALSGCLPIDFNQWGAKNNNENTVANNLMMANNIGKFFNLDNEHLHIISTILDSMNVYSNNIKYSNKDKLYDSIDEIISGLLFEINHKDIHGFIKESEHDSGYYIDRVDKLINQINYIAKEVNFTRVHVSETGLEENALEKLNSTFETKKQEFKEALFSPYVKNKTSFEFNKDLFL